MSQPALSQRLDNKMFTDRYFLAHVKSVGERNIALCLYGKGGRVMVRKLYRYDNTHSALEDMYDLQPSDWPRLHLEDLDDFSRAEKELNAK